MQGDQEVDSLLSLNELSYKKPFALSVASSAQWRVFRSLRDNIAPSQTSSLEISPGASFFDPKTSYLRFRVTAENAAGLLGIGSAVNFISESVVRARSGTELSRSQTHHLQQVQSSAVRQDNSYDTTLGWGERGNTAQGQGTEYILPLSDVNPFFTQTSLIPSQLGTLRLELSWSPVATVFTNANGVGDYLVTDVCVVAKCYDLSDGVLRRLTQIAAATSLTMSWVDISRTLSRGAGNSANVTCVKSCSRALGTMACVQAPNRLTNPAVDSFGLSVFAADTQFQWSLGSAMITTEPQVGPKQGWVQAMHAFGMWGRGNEGYSNSISAGLYTNGFGQISANLERSHSLAYNGTAVSSNRPLILTAQNLTDADADIYVYLYYLRMCSVFSSSNVSIKE
jgi:hypothetical protein